MFHNPVNTNYVENILHPYLGSFLKFLLLYPNLFSFSNVSVTIAEPITKELSITWCEEYDISSC